MKNGLRALGLLLMLFSGYLIVSTLLALPALLQGTRAPLWMILLTALLFLAALAGLFYAGWRLFRGRRKKKQADERTPEARDDA